MFLCLAVNMLPVDDIEMVLESSDINTAMMTRQEKAVYVEKELRICAERLAIPLFLFLHR